MSTFNRSVALASGAVCLALLAACGSSPRSPAPVEDRSARAGTPATDNKPLPGAENAGKPGYYTVRQGDTLIKIGLDHGQNWRDVARWNNLSNPDVIEVGQVLRVAPPGSAVDSAGVVVRPIASPANNAVSAAATSAGVNPSSPAWGLAWNSRPSHGTPDESAVWSWDITVRSRRRAPRAG